MYGDSGLKLDVSDVVLAIYLIYTAYQVISLSLMRLKSTEEPCISHRSYSVKINKILCSQSNESNQASVSSIPEKKQPEQEVQEEQQPEQEVQKKTITISPPTAINIGVPIIADNGPQSSKNNIPHGDWIKPVKPNPEPAGAPLAFSLNKA